MEFVKLPVEIGSWTEEIQSAEVGEEGFYDTNGFRVFWRKYGTKPSDWEIIDIVQIGEVSLENFNQMEKWLDRFGFLNDPSIKKSMRGIKQNIQMEKGVVEFNKKLVDIQTGEVLTPQHTTPKFTQKITPLPLFEKLPTFKNNINNFVVTKPQNFNQNKFQKPFFKQQKFIQKQVHKRDIVEWSSADYTQWILRINSDIYKEWLKVNQLIKKIQKRGRRS